MELFQTNKQKMNEINPNFNEASLAERSSSMEHAHKTAFEIKNETFHSNWFLRV